MIPFSYRFVSRSLALVSTPSSDAAVRWKPREERKKESVKTPKERKKENNEVVVPTRRG